MRIYIQIESYRIAMNDPIAFMYRIGNHDVYRIAVKMYRYTPSVLAAVQEATHLKLVG